jgi:hypothetical protein
VTILVQRCLAINLRWPFCLDVEDGSGRDGGRYAIGEQAEIAYEWTLVPRCRRSRSERTTDYAVRAT